ncbi:thioredoxin domain-containing protein [Mycolicibacterium tokaiense]|uniref:thioredoxin domain-containing protein n=1 Tax=Mycolicibacterium tokaiense TaxID=39695 RepID=UPI000E1C37F9
MRRSWARISTRFRGRVSGSAELKAVVSIYEDFLCPACRNFEMEFGTTINDLIDSHPGVGNR